ncbi:hypothetical protein J6590_014619 [Homalodisca vitripennis]|nr:hypothetical protein J6590_014619 [Homalodisca vitripennis]
MFHARMRSYLLRIWRENARGTVRAWVSWVFARSPTPRVSTLSADASLPVSPLLYCIVQAAKLS